MFPKAAHRHALHCVVTAWLALTVASAPTFFRVAGQARRLYCLPQAFEQTEVASFNTKQDEPRQAVLLELKGGCGESELTDQLQAVDEGMREAVKDKIAILVFSNCPFSEFRDFYRDAGARYLTAINMGAAAVIGINANPGEPSPFLSFTTPVPSCIMDSRNGEALLSALDTDKAVDLVIEPEHMPLHTADTDTSFVDVSFILVKGIFTLEPPIPAWPALFIDDRKLADENIEKQIILARTSSNCLVTAEGSDEFRQCQECWKLASENPASVFDNAAEFKDAFVLFFSKNKEEETSQRCYPEFHQLAMLAQELGAAGVLFGMSPASRRPQFPGPEQIPGELGIPVFSILRSHAAALAPASGEDGVIISVVYDKELGFPPFFASEGQPLENTEITIEVPTESGNKGKSFCSAGQAQFNPNSWDPIKAEGLIAQPEGRCTFENGSGCRLSEETIDLASGKVLIVYSADFPFFHDWEQYVTLALDADASAVLIVNLDNGIYTLQQGSPNSAPMPFFNVDNECGRQIMATAQHAIQLETREVPSQDSRNLIVNLELPGGKNGLSTSPGTSVLDVLTLVDEEVVEFTQALPLTSMRFIARLDGEVEEGVVEMGQAAFNPIGHRGFVGPVAVAEAIAKCRDQNTDAGLNCDACLMGAPRLKPVHPATNFLGKVVMIRETYTHCLHPRKIVDDLESRGAKGAVFANGGAYFRTLPVFGEAGDEERAGIPSFNVMNITSEKFFTMMQEGWELDFEIPSILRGEAEECSSGDCRRIGIVFSSESLGTTSSSTPPEEEIPKSSDKFELSSTLKFVIVGLVVGFAVICISCLAVLAYRRMKAKPYANFDQEGIQSVELRRKNGEMMPASDAGL